MALNARHGGLGETAFVRAWAFVAIVQVCPMDI
jgi:hypothetical protein